MKPYYTVLVAYTYGKKEGNGSLEEEEEEEETAQDF